MSNIDSHHQPPVCPICGSQAESGYLTFPALFYTPESKIIYWMKGLPSIWKKLSVAFGNGIPIALSNTMNGIRCNYCANLVISLKTDKSQLTVGELIDKIKQKSIDEKL